MTCCSEFRLRVDAGLRCISELCGKTAGTPPGGGCKDLEYKKRILKKPLLNPLNYECKREHSITFLMSVSAVHQCIIYDLGVVVFLTGSGGVFFFFR